MSGSIGFSGAGSAHRKDTMTKTPATTRQVSYLEHLIEEADLTAKARYDLRIRLYKGIDKAAASTLIDELAA